MYVYVCTIVNYQQENGSLQRQIFRTTPKDEDGEPIALFADGEEAFNLDNSQDFLSKIIPGDWECTSAVGNSNRKHYRYFPEGHKGLTEGCTFVEFSTAELKESTPFWDPFS